jgi:tetratricopeptide (TPR) repeat protein
MKRDPRTESSRKTISRSAGRELQELIEQITVDAYGEGEQLWAFRQAFEDELPVPCSATVIGEPVTVVQFDFDGNERRGLVAKCRRQDGSLYTVSAVDVSFADGGRGWLYVAAYRKWMGLDPNLKPSKHSVTTKARTQAAAPPLDLTAAIELVVLSVERLAVRCRYLESKHSVTLRAKRFWDLAPGEIVSIRPSKQWNYAGNPYLSGEIESTRIDANALGLTPLRLKQEGMWNPDEEYWGEAGEPIEEWAKPIIARGARPQFEMEQVLPGEDTGDPFSDPIIESNDRKDGGDLAGAEKILHQLCEADLRCLDAHAHLGNLEFEHRPKQAARHYEVGLRIGELSLGVNFDGLLLWRMLDNRPFLRCMHGYGLCRWRLGEFDEAYRTLERMLWLNPPDNQGARFLIEDVQARRSWENRRDR